MGVRTTASCVSTLGTVLAQLPALDSAGARGFADLSRRRVQVV
jgi:hypothetical protein